MGPAVALREELKGGAAALLVGLRLAAGGVELPLPERAEAERAVERARYRFVIGADRPFDEVYPRAVFVKRVRKEVGEEKVLARSFGLTVTPELLSAEYDRIEKTTKAPEQWEAIKQALGSDRRRIEEIFCRPLSVGRALAAKFAFDQRIHAVPHQKAREAREAFLAGKSVPDARIILARRHGELAATTDELLGKAIAESSSSRVLSPPRFAQDAPLSLDPELAVVLERELKLPGDVSTILEERDCFEVFRLIAITEESWKVEAARFSKLDFDSWLESQIRKIPRPSR